ncbi:hypothetical protein [Tepidibacter sp. Z1-5]|uniref:hypothetical protein n=1 Tax=Tepidibacter sp. Z1-5 TaxID=3134138 RepID=UPI0030C37292
MKKNTLVIVSLILITAIIGYKIQEIKYNKNTPRVEVFEVKSSKNNPTKYSYKPYMEFFDENSIDVIKKSISNAEEIKYMRLEVTIPKFYIKTVFEDNTEEYYMWIGEDDTQESLLQNREKRSYYVISKRYAQELKKLLFYNIK